jgi:hypothetical protein
VSKRKAVGQPDVVELDTVIIGPECFAAGDGSVICWQGQNYVPQAETTDVDTVLGFDVNDFRSETVYGIFNDPDAPEYANLPEALHEVVFQTPLYEDDSLPRAIRHARLTNEDRTNQRPSASPALLREQTIMKTPWKTIPLDGVA